MKRDILIRSITKKKKKIQVLVFFLSLSNLRLDFPSMRLRDFRPLFFFFFGRLTYNEISQTSMLSMYKYLNVIKQRLIFFGDGVA